MNQLSTTFNQRKSETLPSDMVKNWRNDGTFLDIIIKSGRVLADPHLMVYSYMLDSISKDMVLIHDGDSKSCPTEPENGKA